MSRLLIELLVIVKEALVSKQGSWVDLIVSPVTNRVWEKLLTEKNNTVRATRKAAYGDIGDQLDEIYKDMDAWKARIKAIKDANPKS